MAHVQGFFNWIPAWTSVGEGMMEVSAGALGICVSWERDPSSSLHCCCPSSLLCIIFLLSCCGIKNFGNCFENYYFSGECCGGFFNKSMCPVTMYSNSGSPTRISLTVSYLISFLLSLGNQQPSIRENPFSEAFCGEKAMQTGLSLFFLFVIICTSA